MYYIDTEKLYGFTPVSNDFIDKYVGKIDSLYIAVYLYIARAAIKGSLPTPSDISDRFFIDKSAAEKIITYWDGEGLFDTPTKPSYTPSEIAKLQRGNSEISSLVSTASAILGKPLGQKEQSAILSLYDYYRLPIDVITILLGHCAEVNRSSISYIEKIAVDWSEKGIKTAEEAEDYLKLYYGDFTKVLKAFGITGRLANSKEKKYIEKWLIDHKQPIELVCEACEEAVINTGKISFKYADVTLEDWFNNNITTIEQAKKYTEEHAVNAKTAKKTKAAKNEAEKPQGKPVRKTTSFSNFEERTYDNTELEALALELLNDNNNDNKEDKNEA